MSHDRYTLLATETDLHEPSGLRVGWAVATDGTAWPWLVSPAGDDADQGCHCRNCAPHDQLGTLPERYRPVARCRRPRRDGKPCRTPVARPGVACANHRDREGSQ